MSPFSLRYCKSVFPIKKQPAVCPQKFTEKKVEKYGLSMEMLSVFQYFLRMYFELSVVNNKELTGSLPSWGLKLTEEIKLTVHATISKQLSM